MVKINMKMLRIALFILIGFVNLFSAQTFAQESRFYKVNIVNTQGKLRLQDITVLPGVISTISTQGNYRYELLSGLGLSLYANHFDVLPSTRSVRIFNPDTEEVTFETITEENMAISLGIPYFPNGKEIDIYDMDNKKVLTISVAHFGKATPFPTQAINPTLVKDNGGSGVFLYIGLGGLGLGIAFAVYLFRTRSPR